MTEGVIARHVVTAPVHRWRWYVAPGCYFYVENAPNAFHRWLQRAFLGLHWERV